jgi:hypothetical protein
MRSLIAVFALAACGPSPNTEAFGFVGEVADASGNGSVIGLFVVSSTPPIYLYKLGDGSTVGNEFDISFAAEPPAEAINGDGVGIAQLGLLPGIATLPDGVVTQNINLGGLTINHAIIYKTADASGPPWSTAFPTGFSCGRCISDTAGGLDTFEPTECVLVVLQATLTTGCHWY